MTERHGMGGQRLHGEHDGGDRRLDVGGTAAQHPIALPGRGEGRHGPALARRHHVHMRVDADGIAARQIGHQVDPRARGTGPRNIPQRRRHLDPAAAEPERPQARLGPIDQLGVVPARRIGRVDADDRGQVGENRRLARGDIRQRQLERAQASSQMSRMVSM